MSSFPSGIPSTKSEAGVQSGRDVEPTTASLSLPPLSSIDPLQRFTSHPSQDPGLSKGLPPPGLPPISQYHRPQLPGISQYHITSSNPPLGHASATGHPAVQVDCLPHPTSLPIAPSGSHRLLSGGRHKKEVKRRTKTGCMTCRRRRIKVSHLLLTLKRGAKDGCGFAQKTNTKIEGQVLAPDSSGSGLCPPGCHLNLNLNLNGH